MYTVSIFKTQISKFIVDMFSMITTIPTVSLEFQQASRKTQISMSMCMLICVYLGAHGQNAIFLASDLHRLIKECVSMMMNRIR